MKTLYVRPGAKDDSGNAVGFKAVPGTEEARHLLKEGYVPVSEDGAINTAEVVTALTAEDLMNLDVKALKAMAKEMGLKGYSNLHEVQLVAAIMAAQAEAQSTQETEGTHGEIEHGGADNQAPPTGV